MLCAGESFWIENASTLQEHIEISWLMLLLLHLLLLLVLVVPLLWPGETT